MEKLLCLFVDMKFYYALFLVALVMTSAFYVEGSPVADHPDAADHPDGVSMMVLESSSMGYWRIYTFP